MNRFLVERVMGVNTNFIRQCAPRRLIMKLYLEILWLFILVFLMWPVAVAIANGESVGGQRKSPTSDTIIDEQLKPTKTEESIPVTQNKEGNVKSSVPAAEKEVPPFSAIEGMNGPNLEGEFNLFPKGVISAERPVFYGFIQAIIGGISAGSLMLTYFGIRRRMENRALLSAFATEFVLAFERCVIYLRQYKTQELSFSALFVSMGASEVARLASVTNEPKILERILELQARYFQVKRHVDEASSKAFQWRILTIRADRAHAAMQQEEYQAAQNKANEFRDTAVNAQGAAIAFFSGSQSNYNSYEEIRNDTQSILTALRKNKPWFSKKFKPLLNDLDGKFRKSELTVEAIRSLVDRKGEEGGFTMEEITEEEKQISKPNKKL